MTNIAIVGKIVQPSLNLGFHSFSNSLQETLDVQGSELGDGGDFLFANNVNLCP